jgi:hypothetical protein
MDKKWDSEAIDQVYENLIDEFGLQLDTIALSGFRIQLEEQIIFRKYLSLLERLEQELLIQWNIKQSQGIEALLREQNSWLSKELRKKRSLFDDWTELCSLLWNQSESTDNSFYPSIWKPFVIKTFIQREFWGELSGGLKTDQRELIIKKICQLMEILSKVDPHHQILSFLNLIELGTHKRPPLCEIGKPMEKSQKGSQSKSIMQPVISAVGKEDWGEVPRLLSQYWHEKEEKN